MIIEIKKTLLDCKSCRTAMKTTDLNLPCQALLFADIISFYIQSE